MKNVQAKFVRSYTSQKGNKTFVYTVSGTPEQMEAYKKSKGDFYREDEKTKEPLFFTTRYFGEKGSLVVTSKGEFVADTTEIDKLASLSDQFGIDVALSVQGSKHNVNPEAVTAESTEGSK